MVVFWFLQPDFFIENLPVSGIVFYLWVGMFGVFVVAQFWAFAADVYSDEEGRRLIPMVAIGATAGAAFGAQITEFLVEGGFADLLETLGLEALAALARQILVTKSLLLLALLPLGASIVLTRIVDRRRRSPGPAAGAGGGAGERVGRPLDRAQQPLPAGRGDHHAAAELGEHERREPADPRPPGLARGAGGRPGPGGRGGGPAVHPRPDDGLLRQLLHAR